ncbi:hypothetical protein ACIBI8_09300 [Streptomyces sp. NPDC050529]|uniref:hypothetical protein n=1 Tax=Streptomyces sp. NPDC050529 TaxID=3365624 RepID=UPI0037AB3366
MANARAHREGELLKPTEQVLQHLTQPSNISVHADEALVGKVKSAIAAEDKKRKENQDEPPRRKPTLAPIPQTEELRAIGATSIRIKVGASRYEFQAVVRAAAGRPLLTRPGGEASHRTARPGRTDARVLCDNAAPACCTPLTWGAQHAMTSCQGKKSVNVQPSTSAFSLL